MITNFMERTLMPVQLKVSVNAALLYRLQEDF